MRHAAKNHKKHFVFSLCLSLTLSLSLSRSTTRNCRNDRKGIVVQMDLVDLLAQVVGKEGFGRRLQRERDTKVGE